MYEKVAVSSHIVEIAAPSVPKEVWLSMGRRTIALCSLLFVSAVACGADSPPIETLNPEALLAKIERFSIDKQAPRWDPRARVKCVVSTEDDHRRETADGTLRNDMRLRPVGDPSLKFVVALSEKVKADLRRLGIENI